MGVSVPFSATVYCWSPLILITPLCASELSIVQVAV